ncbi:MAG: hydroxymethylbilane synthase [Proteobacteria bacterium]|nr:hydroxymethylbilane synthase [Pseudomonadota bacterium]
MDGSLQVDLVGITTDGDKWLDAPLAEVGGKGLFIKQLETAMLEGQADMAIHSMKDVPAVLPEGFCLPVIGWREDVRDALVSPFGTLTDLPQGARVGSSSLRRVSQLKALRPDLHLQPVRGNVDSRLKKLDAGDYDAIVLAAAGLNRLGLAARITEIFEPDRCLPSAGQGALGIECLAEHTELLDLLAPLNDERTAKCVSAERGVSEGLGADCSMPLAAHAFFLDGVYTLTARLASVDGLQILAASAQGPDARDLSGRVVAELNRQGAADLLDRLR